MNKGSLSLMLVLLGLIQQSYSQVSFTVNPDQGCVPLNVTFTNTSSSGNYYVWNFGDGSMSNLQNPTHTYNYTTVFYPSLSVYDTTGGNMNFLGDFTYMNGINISGSNLYVSADTVCPGEEVNFNLYPGGSNISWDFGDGATGSGSNIKHAYNTDGSYNITVTANTSCGAQVITRTIVVNSNAMPVANFYTQNNIICPNEEISFDPQNSSALSYSWNFGDGSTSNVRRPEHSYATPGTYNVSLTITNLCGNTDTETRTITVQSNLPIPSFVSIYAPSEACPNDMVRYGFYGSAVTRIWTFDDGDTSFAEDPMHSYSTMGNHITSLYIQNGCGRDTTIYHTININGNIEFGNDAYMYFEPQNACPGSPIMFAASNAVSYLWDFGDGSSSNMQQPVHSYSAVGNYNVSLTLTNGCSNDTIISNTIQISNNIVPELEFDNNWGTPMESACPNDSVIFYAMGGTSYLWEFGDGTSTTQTTPLLISEGNGFSFYVDIVKHPYSSTGTYKVKLTYTNGCGNSAVDSTMFTVGSNAPASGGIVPLGSVYNACQEINFLGFGGVNYMWNFGDGDSATTVNPNISHSYSSPGIYNVKLKFTNGCGVVGTENIQINVKGMEANISKTDITCFGLSNGSATVNVTNGIPPYQYKIGSGAFQASPTFNNLSSGVHTVTITDSTGCSITDNFTITSPSDIIITATTVNSTCGQNDGSASLSVSGGTPAYTYSWSNGNTTSTANSLIAGVYSILVTDMNGCQSNASISINDIGGPAVGFSPPISPVCEGSAAFTLTGGTPAGGTYAGTGVSGGIFNPAIAGAGSHSIIYTYSSGGCTSSASQNVVVNSLPVVAFNNTNDTVCDNLGMLTLTGGSPSGGTYSGTGVTGNAFNPAIGGGIYTITYTYTGTDNCTNSATATIFVDVCSGLEEMGDQRNVNIYPNPFSSSFVIDIKGHVEGVMIQIYDVVGKTIYSQSINDDLTVIERSGMQNGIYFFKITGKNGIIKTGTLVAQ